MTHVASRLGNLRPRQETGAALLSGAAVLACCLVATAGGCVRPEHQQTQALGAQPAQVEAACVEMREVVAALLARPEVPGDTATVLVVDAMGRSKDPVFVPFLMEVLADGEKYKAPLPDRAAEALGEIGHPAALGLLQRSIAAGRVSKLAGVRAMGRLAVNGGSRQAAEHVVDALAHGDDAARGEAASSLRCKKVDHLLPDLEKALEQAAQSDKSPDVRMRAALVLVREGRKEFVADLKEIAASPNDRVRLTLVYALGISGETLPIMLQLLTDENSEVSGAAWEQLAKEMGSVNLASWPQSVEQAREMAETYRKAWHAEYSQRQNRDE